MNVEVWDNVGGWELESMDWDPDTGVSLFLYTHPTFPGLYAYSREQPTLPEHQGWKNRPEQAVFGIRK